MADVVAMKFPTCCWCDKRARHRIEYVCMDNMVPSGPPIYKHFCDEHVPPGNDDNQEAGESR